MSRQAQAGLDADGRSGRADIVIAGGGAAGLALAVALRHAAGNALSVTVVDPALASKAADDSRAYAIVGGARRFLAGMGAWEDMAPHAGPIRRMEITDSGLEELVRPLMLDLAQPDTDSEIANMLPSRVISTALRARAAALGVTLIAGRIDRFALTETAIEAHGDGIALRARLLVAADGRGSTLRQQAGIPAYGWAYPQIAIVGTITHSLGHEQVAVQHFLPAGPFAMLPLKSEGDRQSSIVWSETPDVAARLLAGDPDDLLDEVDARAGGRFGVIRDIRDVQSFPLSLSVARRFVAPRLALLGDAAHALHPLAGQGLNYGLRGAAALAEAVLDTARIGLDIGGSSTLDTYERNRRADVMTIAMATESLNRLFSTDLGPVRALRDLGLGLFNRVPSLKAAAIREAAGEGRLAPRAFRREPG